jgi:DnaJ-class molecular chaperone
MLQNTAGLDGHARDREIVKVPCAHCGGLMEITKDKCDSCGAPRNNNDI